MIKQLVFTLLVTLILLIIGVWSRRFFAPEIYASDVVWRPTDQGCEVTFLLHNNSNSQLDAKTRVRVYRKRIESRGGAIVFDPTSEIFIDAKSNPADILKNTVIVPQPADGGCDLAEVTSHRT
jgi:hypothetical protein